ncbi:hypothetical protein LY76DRAFT_277963 [Colletotrichum caudatum]|nr:hypothetical protein LY76DRAFT_277963 [Colletotrichum caudatum]
MAPGYPKAGARRHIQLVRGLPLAPREKVRREGESEMNATRDRCSLSPVLVLQRIRQHHGFPPFASDSGTWGRTMKQILCCARPRSRVARSSSSARRRARAQLTSTMEERPMFLAREPLAGPLLQDLLVGENPNFARFQLNECLDERRWRRERERETLCRIEKCNASHSVWGGTHTHTHTHTHTQRGPWFLTYLVCSLAQPPRSLVPR